MNFKSNNNDNNGPWLTEQKIFFPRPPTTRKTRRIRTRQIRQQTYK